jgi:hypothetical protein
MSGMKCEMVTKILTDDDGFHIGEVECGRDAIFCDNGERMCFTCARAVDREGDILTPRGTRRFREIERIVASLPS